jgi:hypothetical protein
MAVDRFINWEKRIPAKSSIRFVLEDYLGDAAEEITYGTLKNGKSKSKDMEFWSIKLRGKPQFPFKRLPEFKKRKGPAIGMEPHKERWFEVVWTPDGIDVITRLSDEYTSVVANGFAAMCARYWQTKVHR